MNKQEPYRWQYKFLRKKLNKYGPEIILLHLPLQDLLKKYILIIIDFFTNMNF